jgi:hypothetical protein
MNAENPWIRAPREVPAHVQYAHRYGRGMLTFEQVDELVKSINPEYVDSKQKLTYLAQHQARAEMNRIFGYANWDLHTDQVTPLYEEQRETGTGQGKAMRWIVGYRAQVTVNIRDLWGMPLASYTGVHAEENAPQPNRGEAHALALTSVDSYALRRALINLGDRFGLGLYDGGKVDAHGKYTIQQQGGVLFDWVDMRQQQPQQALPQEPPAPAGTADAALQQMATPSLQSPPVARPPVAKRFPQAVDQVQQMNQAAREQAAQQGGYPAPQPQAPSIPPGTTDALRARMQGAFKVDAEDERERYERENDYANEQAMQQHRGGVVE